jgi:hypothetical protein
MSGDHEAPDVAPLIRATVRYVPPLQVSYECHRTLKRLLTTPLMIALTFK